MRAAVVLGSAPGGIEELKLAPAGVDILAVNAAGYTYLGPIAAWGSVHADQMVGWLERRAELGGPGGFHAFGESFLPGQERDVVRYYGPTRWRGTSALYVVQWAMDVGGYDRLALAGVHIKGNTRDRGGQLEDTDGGPYENYQLGWHTAIDEIRDHVRSYGGWTAELLGTPEPGWLTGEA